jgi:hypothetical protein
VHFSGKYTPLEDFKKRYMVTLRKALERSWFLLSKTCRNKKRLSKSIIQCWGVCRYIVPVIPVRREKI